MSKAMARQGPQQESGSRFSRECAEVLRMVWEQHILGSPLISRE